MSFDLGKRCTPQSLSVVVVLRFHHVVILRQHISTFREFSQLHNVLLFDIWLTQKQQMWDLHSITISISGALLQKTDFSKKVMNICDFH